MAHLISQNKRYVNEADEQLEQTPAQFITEESVEQINQIVDKGFSPWIRVKCTGLSSKPQRDFTYHQFLNNILVSPKYKARSKQSTRLKNNESHIVKLNFQQEIIGSRTISFDLKNFETPNRSYGQSFFEKRRNMSKAYERPKSIQLTLDAKTLSLKSTLFTGQTGKAYFAKNLTRRNPQSTTFRNSSTENEKNKRMSQTMKEFYTVIPIQERQSLTLQPKSLSLLKNSQKPIRHSPDIIKQAIKTKGKLTKEICSHNYEKQMFLDKNSFVRTFQSFHKKSKLHEKQRKVQNN